MYICINKKKCNNKIKNNLVNFINKIKLKKKTSTIITKILKH